MTAMSTPFIARRARVLTSLWLVTGVLTALPALLLMAFAEDAPARGAAFLLLGSAATAIGTGLVVGRGTRKALRISLAASALVVLAAGSALAVLASTGTLAARDGLILGGLAIVGAALSATVAMLRLRSGAGSSAATGRR
jgi:hypothetical protein